MIFTDRCDETGRTKPCAVCARSGHEATIVTGFGSQGSVIRFEDGETTWAAPSELTEDS